MNDISLIRRSERMMSKDRHFLFLQGLPGPFFRLLASALRDQTARVSRICFNGGDWFDWRLPNATAYRGGLTGWEEWLARHVQNNAVTDIILFGDCRPLHLVGRTVAARLGIHVHVFEEGYIRPDFVTLERGGVNGNSNLPLNLGEYRKLDQGTVTKATPVENFFSRRAFESIFYHLAMFVGSPIFLRYKSHRARSMYQESFGWISRGIRRPLEESRSRKALSDLRERPFFLFPLQLDGDSQLQHHSPFESMAAAAEQVVASFATSAPQELALVVKMHPLDPDTYGWRRQIKVLARKHGVEDRIAFIERGDLDALLRSARGVVCVNSTVGPLALQAGTPVYVLGEAIYKLEGLVAGDCLERFWTTPGVVDPTTNALFRRVLIDTCLINGGFHSEKALSLLVENSVHRILQGILQEEQALQAAA